MSAEGARGAENRERRRSQRREDFRKLIVDRLDVLRARPSDILVLHLPPEVTANPTMFREAQEGAMQVMEAARRPVILLPEGTELTAETVEPFLREMGFELPEEESSVYVPPKQIITPQGVKPVREALPDQNSAEELPQ